MAEKGIIAGKVYHMIIKNRGSATIFKQSLMESFVIIQCLLFII
jgi:hypothetical protein